MPVHLTSSAGPLACALAACLSGCGPEPLAMSGSTPEPVIQIMLLVGTAPQVVSVSYSTPARPAIPETPLPIPAESVSLALEGPGGTPVPFLPAPGAAGRFVAAITAEARTTYRLTGSVAGRAVAAEVTTPGPLEILEPRADTVTLSLADARPALNFTWRATGAVLYTAIQVKSSDERFAALLRTVWDTSTVLFPHPFFQRPETTEVRVLALEPAAARFFDGPADQRGQRLGNITGAYGVLGAASGAAPKVIVWQ